MLPAKDQHTRARSAIRGCARLRVAQGDTRRSEQSPRHRPVGGSRRASSAPCKLAPQAAPTHSVSSGCAHVASRLRRAPNDRHQSPSSKHAGPTGDCRTIARFLPVSRRPAQPEIAHHEREATESIFHAVRRLSLPRNMLARVVELSVVLDRAAAPAQSGVTPCASRRSSSAPLPRGTSRYSRAATQLDLHPKCGLGRPELGSRCFGHRAARPARRSRASFVEGVAHGIGICALAQRACSARLQESRARLRSAPAALVVASRPAHWDATTARSSTFLAHAASAVGPQHAAADGSTKLLVELDNGDRVEAVHMPRGGRVTLCISSQVGCAMGCTFCATASMGFGRHFG